MISKVKIIVALLVFVLMIAGVAIVYNTLSKEVSPRNNIGLAETSGAISETDVQKQAAPDFAMEDPNGNTVRLSDMKGKPVVLNFWASWCPPCQSEMPEFDKVCAELGNAVQFVMVDLTDGQRETPDLGAAYVEEQGFTFPVYFDIHQEGADAYGIRSIPTTIFIDKDGYIVTSAQGAIDELTLRNGIAMAQ